MVKSIVLYLSARHKFLFFQNIMLWEKLYRRFIFFHFISKYHQAINVLMRWHSMCWRDLIISCLQYFSNIIVYLHYPHHFSSISLVLITFSRLWRLQTEGRICKNLFWDAPSVLPSHSFRSWSRAWQYWWVYSIFSSHFLLFLFYLLLLLLLFLPIQSGKNTGF